MEITLSLFRKIKKLAYEAGILDQPNQSKQCCRFTFLIKGKKLNHQKWIDVQSDKASIKVFRDIVDKAVGENISKNFVCLSVTIARKRSVLLWNLSYKNYTTLDQFLQNS